MGYWKDNSEQVPFAYNLYKSNKPEDAVIAVGFKQTFCREVPIDFVGVWYVSLSLMANQVRVFRGSRVGLHRDTVSSVGVIASTTLPFVRT